MQGERGKGQKESSPQARLSMDELSFGGRLGWNVNVQVQGLSGMI